MWLKKQAWVRACRGNGESAACAAANTGEKVAARPGVVSDARVACRPAGR